MLFTVLPLLKEGVSFPRACGLHLGELSDRSCAGAVCLESKFPKSCKNNPVERRTRAQLVGKLTDMLS